ncbi:MAG TPA: DUF4126 domain-containing protein [Gemmatimonas sp.]|uniref:DUF4126 domain-containing protein n=1 Tax=Gemmatimonas sp. TaxID=1962908 RepID=UPI002ED7F530
MIVALPVSAEALLGVAVGLGLAAAAGFRVFVPLLAAAVAAKTGLLTLSPGFEWLASTPALAALGTATVLEVGAYAVPWLDQLLDIVATPAAMLAGMLAAASVVVDLPPLIKWSAVVLAAGAAGMTQGATVFTRFKSTTLTGGVGNPMVSTLELVSAVVTSALAIFLPMLTLVAVILLLVFFTRRVHGVIFGRRGARKAGVTAGGPPRVPRGP